MALSLQQRNISTRGDINRVLIDRYFHGEGDVIPSVHQMLAESSVFCSFLRFVEGNGNPDVARVIDVGTSFQRAFSKEKGRNPDAVWSQFLNEKNPRLLRLIGRSHCLYHPCVKAGWHYLWTPRDRSQGLKVVAAKGGHADELQLRKQKALLTKFCPESLDSYSNDNDESNKLESKTGFRRNRFSFFLADDAIAGVSGIYLTNSYTQASADELVFFPMHARFFFICAATDLVAWLKLNSTRELFGNALRIEGYRYPASVVDIDRYAQNPELRFSEFDFRAELGATVLAKIPPEELHRAYGKRFARKLGEMAPHLDWVGVLKSSRDPSVVRAPSLIRPKLVEMGEGLDKVGIPASTRHMNGYKGPIRAIQVPSVVMELDTDTDAFRTTVEKVRARDAACEIHMYVNANKYRSTAVLNPAEIYFAHAMVAQQGRPEPNGKSHALGWKPPESDHFANIGPIMDTHVITKREDGSFLGIMHVTRNVEEGKPVQYYIEYMGILPGPPEQSNHGQGYGAKAIVAVIEDALSRDPGAIIKLDTSARDRNEHDEEAFYFYRKVGFKVVQRGMEEKGDTLHWYEANRAFITAGFTQVAPSITAKLASKQV